MGHQQHGLRGVPVVEDLKNVPHAARTRKGKTSRKKVTLTSSTELGGKHMQYRLDDYARRQ